MLNLDSVMTAAGTRALRVERHGLRIQRASAFLRRQFAPRVAHLNDAELTDYAAGRLADFARGGLISEQDQLSALALVIHWGPAWQDDHMPQGIMPLAGQWAAPQTVRQRLSQSLQALDIWHAAIRHDLGDRHRAASLMHELYADPRVIARHGRDPRDWCALFAPRLWSVLPDAARRGHCAAAATFAARVLPSFQDGILFACVGMVLGVRFAVDPLYPQFAAALSRQDNPDPDMARLALGDALVTHWRQIGGDEQQ